ncbi:MAG: DUF664 domain-containing protein [Actinomycetales bacterium]
MEPEVELWLWYVGKALDDMCGIVSNLGDDLANRRPDLPGANSPYAILTHCCGVMNQWAGEVVADRTVQRDRAAEFVAHGSVADLLPLVARTRSQLRRDVEAVRWNAEPLGPVDPQDRDTPLGRSQGGVLLHIYEELSQHLGQMEITRDVLLGSR